MNEVMNDTIDLSNNLVEDAAKDVIELMDDEDDEVVEVDNVEIVESVDVRAEEKRKRRRRLKLLLHPSVTPSFIAIISPDYEDHLPKRFKVNFNEHLGLTNKAPTPTFRMGGLKPTPMAVPSFPVAPLPNDEGYFEGIVNVTLPDDSQYLNELHMMIRQQLEIFSATDEDVRTTQAGRRTPTVRGKVGVRCSHCAKVVLKDDPEKRFWPPGSVSYPINVEGLYSVCTQKPALHYETCPHMPDDVKGQLYRMSYDAAGVSIRRQNLNNTGHSSISAGNYYLISAKRIGLINVPGGIRFGRDLGLDPLSVEAVRAEVEGKSGRKTNGQFRATPTESTAPLLLADKISEQVLAEAIAEKDSGKIIGRSDDSKLVTNFVFLCVRQMAYCHAMPADFETRGKKTALMRLGFTGFCCRHCDEVNNPETSTTIADYSCRSFTSAADNLSSAITNSFYLHLQKCYLVPMEIRKALAAYKRIHSRQISRLPHGSQRRLFHAIWARLRAVDMTEEEMLERVKNAPPPRAPEPAPVAIVPAEQPSFAAPESIPSNANVPDSVASLAAGSAAGFSGCIPKSDNEETVRLLQAAENDTDYTANGNMIQPGDRPLVTDYVFFMFRNMQIAIPNATDFTRGRRTTILNTRLAGFCCKHCYGKDGSASGRSFPSQPDNMASSLNTSLYSHMQKCYYVPDNLKRAIANLKRLHSQQCANLKFGSQRKFFNKVFARLKAVAVPSFDVTREGVVKMENGVSTEDDDESKLTEFGFFRIAPDLVECTRCRLVPLSLRAPNAVSISSLNRDKLATHKQHCKGQVYNVGRLVDVLSKIMDLHPSVTYDALERDSFKAIVKELVGERPGYLECFTSTVLHLVKRKRGDLVDSSVSDPETVRHVPATESATDSSKVATLFESWTKEVGDLDSISPADKHFLQYFQLISPTLMLS